MPSRYGPHNPDETYVSHGYPEHQVDLGDMVMNYAVAGSEEKPALLLLPSQSESWWGYEDAMKLLEAEFQVFAVDLRGQGRSSRTPGRYTLNNMGNDLVRFISLVIKRPCFVAGLSSGAVISAWLSAYAMPGQILAAIYEDPPLYHSEANPALGAGMRQGIGPFLSHLNKYLGDQWTIGDWEGCVRSAGEELPDWLAMAFFANWSADEVDQGMKEYDPEWGKAFSNGTWSLNCDHDQMLTHVKVPVLLTHHLHIEDPETGSVMGALSDRQARRALSLIQANGQTADYQSFPEMGHRMHSIDPQLYATTITDWLKTKNPNA